MRRGIFTLLATVAAGWFWMGCQGLKPRKIHTPRDHVLMFDTEGQAADPTGNHACRQGGRAEKPKTRGSAQEWCEGKQWVFRSQPWLTDELFAEQRRGIFEGLREHAAQVGPRRLLIFVHGGLNPRDASLERAAQLVPEVEGGVGEAKAYPLFINWRSSLRSSYHDHLFKIRQGKNLGAKAAIVSPFIALGDVFRGVLRIPISVGNEVKNARRMCNRCRLNVHVAEVEAELVQAGGDGGVRIRPGTECKPRFRSTAARSTSLLVTIPTVKLVTAPAIDTLGVASWSMMRRRTGLLFYSEDELRTQQMVPSVARTPDPQGHLAVFLRELAKELTSAAQRGEAWTVDLVGHSMGAIVVNEIVRELGDVLPIRNIVYMAAACSLEEYHQTVIPYLEAHPEARMFHLTLHPKAELRERHAWDLPPRGSLLVWLDDFLTPSETPFERRAGRYDNLLRVMHLTPREVTDQIQIKAFGLGHCADKEPQRHGDFGEKLRFWDPACWQADPFDPGSCFL